MIRQALSSAQEPSQGLLASLLGFLVLLFGATGVFGELQSALQRLWTHGHDEVPPLPWWHGASLRLRGVAYVLAFGFLLLVSLAVSTLLNLFTGWAGNWLPIAPLLRVLNEATSFAVCAALFVGLMRMSAGPKPGCGICGWVRSWGLAVHGGAACAGGLSVDCGGGFGLRGGGVAGGAADVDLFLVGGAAVFCRVRACLRRSAGSHRAAMRDC